MLRVLFSLSTMLALFEDLFDSGRGLLRRLHRRLWSLATQRAANDGASPMPEDYKNFFAPRTMLGLTCQLRWRMWPSARRPRRGRKRAAAGSLLHNRRWSDRKGAEPSAAMRPRHPRPSKRANINVQVGDCRLRQVQARVLREVHRPFQWPADRRHAAAFFPGPEPEVVPDPLCGMGILNRA